MLACLYPRKDTMSRYVCTFRRCAWPISHQRRLVRAGEPFNFPESLFTAYEIAITIPTSQASNGRLIIVTYKNGNYDLFTNWLLL